MARARSSRRWALILTLAAFATNALPAGSVLAADGKAAGSDAVVKAIVTYDGKPGRAEKRTVKDLGGKVRYELGLVDGLAVELPRGQFKKLRADAGVSSVETDGKLVAFDHGTNTGDLEYENAWGVEHIGTREVHLAGNTGQGVKLAIIDTGIDYIHNDPDDLPITIDPEFSWNYAGGEDFLTFDGDPYDDNGHGTHVAGIAAANHNGYLVTGVAPDVDLYALKVLGATGEGDYSGLIAALGWAVANDIDVVNMSLGGHEVSAALQTAIANAYDAGITLVAASGNVNPANIYELLYGCPVAYPAAYDQVIAVSFTGTADKLTGFSCTGTQVDLAAPGDGIISPVPVGPTGSCMFCSPNGYSAQSGTSMASPHVAGVVALVLNAGIADDGDGLLADDIKAHLCANTMPASGMTTTDPRYPKWYGCGIVDADKALIDNPPPSPTGGIDAADDVATVTEDGLIDVAVLANDSDPDGETLSVTAVTDPAHGTTSINPDGTVTYSPDPNYAGSDAFDYTVANTSGDDATAAVAVTVSPVNDDPVAVDDSLVTLTGTPASLDVRANDSDVDGDTLTTTAVGPAAHGSTSIEADGSVSYAPNPAYAGSDSFSYTVSDGAGGSATASVAVSVIATNAPPAAMDDVLTVAEDATGSVDAIANDLDADGGGLSVTSVTQPANGVATIGAGGAIEYTPDADYNGSDAFDYTVADAIGATDTATVVVTVTPANDDPIAVDDVATVAEDDSINLDVAGNDTDIDGDTLQVSSVDAPVLGSAALEADGTVTYTPPANYWGADSFTYTVSDGAGGTDVGSVSVTVDPVNDAPTVNAKTVATNYQTKLAMSLTGSDVETCNLTFQIVTPPTHGTLTSPSSVLCVTLLPPYSDSAKVTYTPAAGYSGPDSFTFRASDGSTWSAPALVDITVRPPILLHIADLDASRTVQTNTWTAKVTIRVHDAGHANVRSVTVSGSWSGGATGTATCKTSSSGTCVVSKSSIPKTTPNVTFTVTGTSLPASAYDPPLNHDPDGDSDGTVIVVPGP